MSFQEIGKLNPNAFDLETVLTRAVYRVLNNNIHDFTSNSVEKPKVHFQGVTNHGQVRLVAEQLCKRIERRYERKLQEELEKERGRMERKLGQIKEEYREELDHKKKELAHEKTFLEERMREKERTLQHMMDIRALDKETSIDVQRKVLENRQLELRLAAERLEKANEEFKKRMKDELESLRLEWEKLALRETEMSTVNVDLSQARSIQELKRKVNEALKDAETLKKKMLQLEKEKEELTMKNTNLEEELRLTLFRMRDRDSSGGSILVKEILDQNAKLKEDLLKNEMRSRSDSSSEISRLTAAHQKQEEAQSLKIKEQQQIIELMNTRIRHLTAEKNYLKEELKEVKRENYYQKGREKKREKTKPVAFSSSNESLSSSEASSISNGSIEIANFKKRMSSLDHIAKQLDASVEILTMTASHKRQLGDDTHHGYDDFCRGIIQNGGGYYPHSSPAKPLEKSQAYFSEPKNPERTPEKIVSVPARIQEKPKSPVPVEVSPLPIESEFEKKLRERNEQMNRKISVTVASEEPLIEVTKENPLFQPVTASSAMADYMSMFSRPAEPSAQLADIDLPEEVQLDPVAKSDDEIDW